MNTQLFFTTSSNPSLSEQTRGSRALDITYQALIMCTLEMVHCEICGSSFFYQFTRCPSNCVSKDPCFVRPMKLWIQGCQNCVGLRQEKLSIMRDEVWRPHIKHNGKWEWKCQLKDYRVIAWLNEAQDDKRL